MRLADVSDFENTMTTEKRIKGRKIGVIGMARSGIAAAFLAKRFGGNVFVSDAASRRSLADRVDQITEAGIPFETDRHTGRLLECDYVVVSPGVPLTIDVIEKLRRKGIPVFSELEFASWTCRGRMVAVTGSNGKTTTTTLIGEILKRAGLATFVCGNIGSPFAEVADKIPEEGIAVVEVSTFQLETIDDFKPHIAMILNLTPDHLDRHGSFEAYKSMKFRITENQGADDYLIVNRDDLETERTTIATDARLLRFSIAAGADADTRVEQNYLCVGAGSTATRIVSCDDIGIRGNHNLQNAAASALTARLLGIRPEVIAETLKTFPGVEHRLEPVARVAGISFINDSKATNVESVVVALQAVTEPVHLIMGGRDKGSPYDPLVEAGRGKAKGIIAIGEARERIFAALGAAFPVQFAGSLAEAVTKAFEAAYPGDAVLLSPGCASFDMFKDYEHRGKAFKAVVATLTENRKNNETLSNR
jgi:UDP-N-acetylmuramoylalanine--D-glutamate ligase